MFDRFTDRARRVMGLARQEAERLRHGYIGTEHLLLGIVEEGSGVAASVLRNLDVDLDRARTEVESRVARGDGPPTADEQIPFTPRARKALELSLQESARLGHAYVGTEHILLGLIREKEGVAAQVLRVLGARIGPVRDEVLDVIGPAGDSAAESSLEAVFPVSLERPPVAAARPKVPSGFPPSEPGAPPIPEAPDPTERAPRGRPAGSPRGRTDEIERELAKVERDKATALAKEDFERAATLRDRGVALRAERDRLASGPLVDVLTDAVRVARGAAGVLKSAVTELERIERAMRTRRSPTSPEAEALEALVRVLRVQPEALTRLLQSVNVGNADFLAALIEEVKRVAAGPEDEAAGPPSPTAASG